MIQKTCIQCCKSFRARRLDIQCCSLACRKKRSQLKLANTSCYCCGSNVTALNQKGYPNWYYNGITGLALCNRCYKNLIRGYRLNAEAHYSNRICHSCGSSTTYVSKAGLPQWYDDPTNPAFTLCSKCYKHKYENPRSIRFKDKRIIVEHPPRKGICQKCGKKGLTNIHHEKYDLKNPLAYTIELCISCHYKETWRLKQFVNRQKVKG